MPPSRNTISRVNEPDTLYEDVVGHPPTCSYGVCDCGKGDRDVDELVAAAVDVLDNADLDSASRSFDRLIAAVRKFRDWSL